MKTVLITGAAGFIGTNLVLRLLEDPYVFVVGVDNLLTSAKPAIENERYDFVQCDIVSESYLLDAVDHVDEIYHLASLASPPKYKKWPIETLDVNVIGTRNVLEYAVKRGAKFLLTSTSEVYGDPLVNPQHESYYGNVNTVGERSCYDESKRCAETYVYEYRRKYGNGNKAANFKICRIFNTYGPHMDLHDGRIVTNIIKAMIYNEPVTIYGDGKQTRSLCYIDDLLDGIMALMASEETGPINLGNPYTETCLTDLVKIFETLAGITIQTTYVERMENDPVQRKPDIGLAQTRLGFEPKVELEDGLHRTLLHFVLENPDDIV
jgi:nucleoside-diphosphate-sugar epimerase